jgi:hypothetical protein
MARGTPSLGREAWNPANWRLGKKPAEGNFARVDKHPGDINSVTVTSKPITDLKP